MAELIRTRVGIFKLADAKKLDEIREAVEAGELSEILTGPDRYFPELPSVRTRESADRAAYNGNSLSYRAIGSVPETDGLVRLYDSTGAFIGLFTAENNMLRPYKMLYDTEPEK